MAFWRRETFKYYDERLAKVRQDKLELQKKLENIEVEEQLILEGRCDFGIKKYASIKTREKIISEAESCGYSSKAINKLKEYNEHPWDQDTITNEIINEFIDADNYIRKQKKYKEFFFYKLGDIFGGSEDES